MRLLKWEDFEFYNRVLFPPGTLRTIMKHNSNFVKVNFK